LAMIIYSSDPLSHGSCCFSSVTSYENDNVEDALTRILPLNDSVDRVAGCP
jgi:hypothetical protein